MSFIDFFGVLLISTDVQWVLWLPIIFYGFLVSDDDGLLDPEVLPNKWVWWYISIYIYIYDIRAYIIYGIIYICAYIWISTDFDLFLWFLQMSIDFYGFRMISTNFSCACLNVLWVLVISTDVYECLLIYMNFNWFGMGRDDDGWIDPELLPNRWVWGFVYKTKKTIYIYIYMYNKCENISYIIIHIYIYIQISEDFYWFLCISNDVCSFLQISIDFCGFALIPTDFCDFCWFGRGSDDNGLIDPELLPNRWVWGCIYIYIYIYIYI